ncbi:hypothetical protein D7W82_21010 [Corallococcus sp. CA049B]|uniref:hypothetical protein n=1 Tax=Corallococcus sp. CA049B TaxID=2316730 RepID=UPI000EA07E43|nr:hypothetical protein [Corallococcus sp. CA049B]NOJ95369.1 hypothetical protein [Corallococcus coralloides]RKG84929.1 hypothetical protein D7W82_21010 [Corallococcus sp. CA049B]
MATQKVGGEVDAQCTRCKMNLAHTILAMVGPKIVRVRCNTCGGDHAFRGAAGVTDRPTKAATTRAPRAASSGGTTRAEKVVISFDEQLAGKDLASAPKYSPKDTYKVDQVLHHPTFGVGLVTAVRGDKVDLTFRTDTKTLVHGRGGAPADRPVFSPPMNKHTGPADKPQAELPPEEEAAAETSLPSGD